MSERLQIFDLSQEEREAAIVVVNRLSEMFVLSRTAEIFVALHEGRPLLKLGALHLTRHERICAASVLLLLMDVVGVESAERVIEFLAQPRACAQLADMTPARHHIERRLRDITH